MNINTAFTYIVLLILAFALFGVAAIALSMIESDREALDSEKVQEVRTLLESSRDPLVVLPDLLTIEAGSHGLIGIGIRNDLGKDINLSIAAYCTQCNDWLRDSGVHKIRKDRMLLTQARIDVPKGAIAGGYEMDVLLCLDPECKAIYEKEKLRIVVQ
jgi:hypothetical protein